MNPKIFITAVGAALVLAVPAAWGKGQPADPQWMQALEIRSQELNRQYGLGEHSPAIRALRLRGEALNKAYGLGAYSASTVRIHDARENPVVVQRDEQSTMLDARERALGAKSEAQLGGTGPDVFERAVAARLAETPVVGDGGDRFRIDPTSNPGVTVGAADSGREIEWPAVGFGIGLGILLALGLTIVLRSGRGRELAH